MNSSPTINPKILQRAKEAAYNQTTKVRSDWAKFRIKTYGDLESYGIDLPNFTEEAKTKTINRDLGHFHLFVEPLLKRHVDNTENRLKAAAAAPAIRRRLILVPPESCRKLGKYTLYREQEPVVQAIDKYLYDEGGRLAVIPAGTGAGKTQIMAGVLRAALDRGILNTIPFALPKPIIILTVKNAVYQTIQRLRDCGFSPEIDAGIIHVWPYSALTSSFGIGHLLDEVEYTDPSSGQLSYGYTYKPLQLPYLLILDECHSLANESSQRHKAVKAIDLAARSCPWLPFKVIAMSATPAEKVNDGRLISCMADFEYEKVPITWDNFNVQFARLLCADPTKANKSAVQRMFDAWGQFVFEPPYIKWPYKSINSVRFYEFRNKQDEEYVARAEDDYIERCSKLGKDTPSELALRRIALLQYRKRTEPCRAELMIDDAIAEIKKGNTALIGTAFTGTIIRALFYALDSHPDIFNRNNISVVWGGRGDPRPKKILTDVEMLQILMQEDMSEADYRLVAKNQAWKEDQWLFGDASSEAQDARYQRLKALGLIGVQTQEIRQQEIEKYQSGQSRLCLFTMASGGTGLSFEHCDERQAPRVGLYSVIYNAKEWVQALGRPHRRNSISDTRQYICVMAGTLEETHVAPKLDQKLQSLGAGFSISSKDDIFNALASMDVAELRSKVKRAIRSFDDCVKQADDDNTQLHTVDIHDDEEDDE